MPSVSSDKKKVFSSSEEEQRYKNAKSHKPVPAGKEKDVDPEVLALRHASASKMTLEQHEQHVEPHESVAARYAKSVEFNQKSEATVEADLNQLAKSHARSAEMMHKNTHENVPEHSALAQKRAGTVAFSRTSDGDAGPSHEALAKKKEGTVKQVSGRTEEHVVPHEALAEKKKGTVKAVSSTTEERVTPHEVLAEKKKGTVKMTTTLTSEEVPSHESIQARKAKTVGMVSGTTEQAVGAKGEWRPERAASMTTTSERVLEHSALQAKHEKLIERTMNHGTSPEHDPIPGKRVQSGHGMHETHVERVKSHENLAAKLDGTNKMNRSTALAEPKYGAGLASQEVGVQQHFKPGKRVDSGGRRDQASSFNFLNPSA